MLDDPFIYSSIHSTSESNIIKSISQSIYQSIHPTINPTSIDRSRQRRKKGHPHRKMACSVLSPSCWHVWPCFGWFRLLAWGNRERVPRRRPFLCTYRSSRAVRCRLLEEFSRKSFVLHTATSVVAAAVALCSILSETSSRERDQGCSNHWRMPTTEEDCYQMGSSRRQMEPNFRFQNDVTLPLVLAKNSIRIWFSTIHSRTCWNGWTQKWANIENYTYFYWF